MIVHMRRKALSQGPKQHRDTYGAFAGDPQAKTLCGAEPTTADVGWADVRVATSPAFDYVTCAGCRAARFGGAL